MKAKSQTTGQDRLLSKSQKFIASLCLVAIGVCGPVLGDGSGAPPDNVLSVNTITDLVNLTTAAFVGYGSPISNAVVTVNDPNQGGQFVLTPTLQGTNTGTLLASVGIPGCSWQRQYSGAINITWFGAQGAPADDTIAISNAIATAEINGPGGTVYIPAGTFRAQGLHVHRSTLAGEGSTMEVYMPKSVLELVPNANDNLLYLDEASRNDNQAGSGIHDLTLSGHRSANVVNPIPITSAVDRFNFYVNPATMPNLVDDGTYLHYGFVFFYTSANRYAGYGWIQSVDTNLGLITLQPGYDRYATTNATDTLYTDWTACFTPYVNESAPPRLGGGYSQSFNDPCSAGRIGLVIRSAAVLVQNVVAVGFHCGIAGYTAQNVYFVNVWAQNNSFAGIANADRWSVDSKFERIFAQGFYYDCPGDALENPAPTNFLWRNMAYGVFGFWGESTYDDLSVDSCVVDVADLGGHGTTIKNLLLDVPVKSGISTLGSFSAADPLSIDYLEARAWGSIGNTNVQRVPPSNQGLYAAWDGAIPPRFYDIGQLVVDTYGNAVSNSFSAAFNYNISGQTNSPININEVIEFSQATNWFVGSGPPPLVTKVDANASGGVPNNPNGWVPLGSSMAYSLGGNNVLTLSPNGLVGVSNLNASALTSASASVGALTATGITAQTGNIGTLTAPNLNSSVAMITTLGATTINVTNLHVIGGISTGTLTASSGNITNLNAGTFNANSVQSGSLSSTQGWVSSLGAGTVTANSALINAMTNLSLSANTGVIGGLTSQTATITNLSVSSFNTGTGIVNSFAAGTGNITNLTAGNTYSGSVQSTNVSSSTGWFINLGSSAFTSTSGTINSLATLSLSANNATVGGLVGQTASLTNLIANSANIGAETAGSVVSGYGNITNLTAGLLYGGTVQATNISSTVGWFPTLGASTLTASSASVNALTTLSLTANNASLGGLTIQTATITNLNVSSFNTSAGTVSSLGAGFGNVTNLIATTFNSSTVGASNITGIQGTFTTLGVNGITATSGSINTMTNLTLSANNAAIAGLTTKTGVITNLTTTSLVATNGTISSLSAGIGIFGPLSATTFSSGTVSASNSMAAPSAMFTSLNASTFTNTSASINSLTSLSLTANTGNITGLTTKTGTITNLTASKVYLNVSNGDQTGLFGSAYGGFSTQDILAGQTFFWAYTDGATYSTLSIGAPTATPRNLNISGDTASGTDVKGADLVLKTIPGSGTNTGGGNIRLYTVDATTEGTTVQPFRERLTVLRSGALQLHPPAAAPASGSGEIYSDNSNLYFSDSGGWLPLQRSRNTGMTLAFAFGTINAYSQGIATAAASGTSSSDIVAANPQLTLPNGVVFSGVRMSASGIVEVTLQNVSGAPINAGTLNFNMRILK